MQVSKPYFQTSPNFRNKKLVVDKPMFAKKKKLSTATWVDIYFNLNFK